VKIFIHRNQIIEVVVMVNKNAKIWLFPRVFAPPVFRPARSTFSDEREDHRNGAIRIAICTPR
jgi:hypothetical protein